MSFGDRMSIREHTQHAQCGQCVRYKMLIKKLGADSVARSHQLSLFQQHLEKQYRDRTLYWSARSLSRLPMSPHGRHTICIIQDGIDHNKFRYPRSRIFTSKEFDKYIRPSMDLTCCIVHGKFLLLAMSEPWVRKDSSWCTELTAHCLESLGGDLRHCDLVLQADNCSRECKNNTTTRFAALLTSLHRVRRVELRYLVSGHSHEDIDQFFSAVASSIESAELHTPSHFQRHLEQWLADGSVRPHEALREVLKVDSVRDWSFCQIQGKFFYE